MKKFIKISLLILVIIFVLGITTSNAETFTVTADTPVRNDDGTRYAGYIKKG